MDGWDVFDIRTVLLKRELLVASSANNGILFLWPLLCGLSVTSLPFIYLSVSNTLVNFGGGTIGLRLGVVPWHR
jgi:hypothetical protein